VGFVKQLNISHVVLRYYF